jgi:putative phage-type endonuclease
MSVNEPADGFTIRISGLLEQTALQDTLQWLLDRCGSVGASEIKDVVRNAKRPTARAKLKTRKIVERMTGKPLESYKSQAMIEGTKREPFGRAAAEIKLGRPIMEIGIVRHPTIRWAHASPDGMLEDPATVEIKCPEHLAHMETLLTHEINRDHVTQMQWQMACTGVDAGFYGSWHPDFPPHLQLYIEKVERDQGMIDFLEQQVRDFLDEVETDIQALERAYKGA